MQRKEIVSVMMLGALRVYHQHSFYCHTDGILSYKITSFLENDTSWIIRENVINIESLFFLLISIYLLILIAAQKF